MPTETPTSTSQPVASKPRAKAAKRTTRKPISAKRTNARASAAAKATRTSESPVKQAPADVLGDYAERAVLIPVGAALIARDRVVDSVSETISTYSSTSKTQAQLRRFERRGAKRQLESRG